jgi:gamma-glutamyltranspeptidase/glutathione hydrolase
MGLFFERRTARDEAVDAICLAKHCPAPPECAKYLQAYPPPKMAGNRRNNNGKSEQPGMRTFHLAGRSTVHAENAMVATSHPLAVLAAIEVLRSGGTAVDAAVAASALLAVIEPQSTGIGGDCFALVQPKGEGKIVAYNGSGRAPKAAEASWYLERNLHAIPLTSAHAVSIPGAVDAWATILRDHGRLGLDSLLQPAIKAAEEGYVVAPRIAFDWKNQFEKLKKGTNTERYLLPHGRPALAGDVIRQPELGQTLRAIAKDGRDAFYTGAVAEDVVETLRGIGGLHTLEDFATHTTETTSPIGTLYKDHDVWQCPPNGPGITMLVMLNILSRFDLAKFAPLSVERFHLEAEAARIAYMMREQYIGDPTCADVDVVRILAKEFADQYGDKIRMDRLLDLPVVRPPMNPSTIYITVVDRDRNVCSFINSIAHSFGSAIVSNKTGILLQNRGAGFRIEPGHPNCIAPGKRPLHTIIPGLLTRAGRAQMPFGVMGGQYQPVGQVHVLTNMLDYGCDVQEAIDMPRGLHYVGVYQLEDGVPADVVEGLQKLGHKTASVVSPLGGGQAIWIDWDKGTLTGGSDPRKDGCALGY